MSNDAFKNIPDDLINKAHEDLFEKQECREIVKKILVKKLIFQFTEYESN